MTVRQMLAVIGADELQEWIAYDLEDPTGEIRGDINTAQMMAAAHQTEARPRIRRKSDMEIQSILMTMADVHNSKSK